MHKSRVWASYLKKGHGKPQAAFSMAGWHTIGGKKIYFRSKAERRYAQYLEMQKQQGLIMDWLHEPKTFYFENIRRGVVSYKPDFQVFKSLEDYYWVEVKGYMDPKSRTKIKRFAKYFPGEILYVIDTSAITKLISRRDYG